MDIWRQREIIVLRDYSFCDGVSHPVQIAIRNREEGDIRWDYNDTPFEYYGVNRTHGEASLYAHKVYEHLLVNPGVKIALDIAGGSNGRAIRDLINLGLVNSGLVTNYEDRRNESTKKITELGHVAGDLIKQETWKKIQAWKDEFAPEGFSVIMCRPVGGLSYLPGAFYVGGLATLLDWLQPGGVGLFQIYPEAEHDGCEMLRNRDDIAEVYRDKERRGQDVALIYKK
jgi:hypothetical protein